MVEQTIPHLLQQVSSISKNYDEIAQITGERFNIFGILEVTTQEVRMHSALLANLLNSKGSHGCRGAFLNLFVEQQLNKCEETDFAKNLIGFKTQDSQIKVEHHIGPINPSRTEGGFIDILILDDVNNNHIIIENKIYAGDQYNQLVRYNKFSPTAPIFYLTLDGKQPSEESKGTLEVGNHFVCISYEKDIINWLEACVKEAVNLPMLRETIKQYIYLIKRLTHQTTNNEMKKEIVKIATLNGDNLRATLELCDNVSNIKWHLFNKFISMLDNEFISHNSFNFIMGTESKEKLGEFSPDDSKQITFKKEGCNYFLSINFNYKNKDAYPIQIVVGIKTANVKMTPDNHTEYEADTPWFDNQFSEKGLKNLKTSNSYRNWVWASNFNILSSYFQKDNERWIKLADNNCQIAKEVIKSVNEMLQKIIELDTLVPAS